MKPINFHGLPKDLTVGDLIEMAEQQKTLFFEHSNSVGTQKQQKQLFNSRQGFKHKSQRRDVLEDTSPLFFPADSDNYAEELVEELK